MSIRPPHRIKRNATSEGPSSLLFFDCETLPIPDRMGVGGFEHVLRLGHAIHLRWEGGEPTRRTVCDFRTADEFWRFAYSKMDKKRPLWCFAHNALFDWRLVDGWRRVEENQHERWKYVLGCPPVILRGRIGGRSFRLIDSLNYYRSPLSEIGTAFGLQKMPMPSFTACDADWRDYCRRDVEILEAAITHLRRYIQENDLGVFQSTIGSCAMHSFRHRFMSHDVYCHDNEKVLAMERDSYFGGRAEAYYIGTRKGDYYQLDVNSLYPSVMRDLQCPVRLIRTVDSPSHDWVLRQLSAVGVIAKVWIDSGDDWYPKRREGKPFFPVGSYPTTLAGPELQWAIARGHVMRFGVVSLYELQPIFTKYVDFFYEEKLRHHRSGNAALRMLAKLFGVSLYGKFGQLSPRYAVNERMRPPQQWCKFNVIDKIDDRIYRALAIAGKTWEETDKAESFDSAPAIASYVTSAGRVRMNQLKLIAGLRNSIYEDTDSLICNAEGLDNLSLANEIHPDALGKMKVEGRADVVTIRNLKDYEFGSKHVIGAVQKASWLTSECEYASYRFETLAETVSRQGRASILMREEIRKLDRIYWKRTVQPDGWTVPLIVNEMFDGGLGSGK